MSIEWLHLDSLKDIRIKNGIERLNLPWKNKKSLSV